MIWRQLIKLLQWKGVDSLVLVLFCQEVIQAVLLFGAKSWVLSDYIMSMVESNYVGFLCYTLVLNVRSYTYCVNLHT